MIPPDLLMASQPREIVLQSNVFSVEKMTIELRGGGSAVRHIVRHPGAVCVLGLLDDGRLVTIRNFRVATGQWMNEFCAGKLELGEDPLRAAARELEEETGYRAASIDSLGTFYTSPGFTDELMHAFVARGLAPCPVRLELDERIEVIARTVDAFEDMVGTGEVCDAKTIATYFRWRLLEEASRRVRM